MREAFAHDALVEIETDGGLGAPGGAITLRLCGSWEHPGPCPLAPHHTAAERIEDGGMSVRLRILFAAAPQDEATVRQGIEAALAAGTVTDPEGVARRWKLIESRPSPVREGEGQHAARLMMS